MNLPEFPGSAFFLAFLYSLVRSPEVPGIFRHFLGEGFWGPQIAFSGEDEVDMLGSGESSASREEGIARNATPTLIP